jgi:hypothetical protein
VLQVVDGDELHIRRPEVSRDGHAPFPMPASSA